MVIIRRFHETVVVRIAFVGLFCPSTPGCGLWAHTYNFYAPPPPSSFFLQYNVKHTQSIICKWGVIRNTGWTKQNRFVFVSYLDKLISSTIIFSSYLLSFSYLTLTMITIFGSLYSGREILVVIVFVALFRQ